MNAQVELRQAFNKAVQALNDRKPGQAEVILLKTLEKVPNEPNLSRMLGVALMQQGRFKEAEERLQHVVLMIPEFGEAYETLAEVQFSLENPEDAVKSLQKAIKINPKSEHATFRLAEILAMLGRGPEADEMFEKTFELNPLRKTLVEGMELFRVKNFDDAETKFRSVLRKEPDNIDALRFLGIVSIRQKKHSDAEALLQRAAALAPDFAMIWTNLGLAQSEQGKYKDAEVSLQRALQITPGDPEIYATLASGYVQSGRHDEAIENYQKALNIYGDHFPSHLGMGHALKTIGKQEEAIESYRNCARIRPDYGDVFWSLANLKTYRFTDKEMHIMLEQVERPDIDPDSEISLLFAIAKSYEDGEDYEKAFEFYARGNDKKRMKVQYDPFELENIVDNLIEVFTPEFIADREGWGDPTPDPILVLGLPRSGSTLIEQILASHSMVEGTSELSDLMRIAATSGINRSDGLTYPQVLNVLKQEEYANAGADYIEQTRRQRTDKPIFIDKMPNNFPHIGMMHLILPNAKIIDARRHPLDSCFSCYKQLFANGQTFSYDFFDLAEYYQQYMRIMDHWEKVLPGKVLTVEYKNVVADLETQARAMLEHCGLPWEDAVLEFHKNKRAVRTASSEQVRQPIYSKGLNYWKRFEEHLTPLIEHLEPLLATFPDEDRPASVEAES